MRICIDSCVFITGLTQQDSPDAKLLDLVGPDLYLVIPRLVAQEVTRNLQTPEQVRLFYHLFSHHRFAFVVDEPVPRPLVEDYVVGDFERRLMPSLAPLQNGWKCATSFQITATFCAN